MKTIYLCKIWKNKSTEISYLVRRLQGGNGNFELKIEIAEFILLFEVQQLTIEGELLEIWYMAREMGCRKLHIRDWKFAI